MWGVWLEPEDVIWSIQRNELELLMEWDRWELEVLLYFKVYSQCVAQLNKEAIYFPLN